MAYRDRPLAAKCVFDAGRCNHPYSLWKDKHCPGVCAYYERIGITRETLQAAIRQRWGRRDKTEGGK